MPLAAKLAPLDINTFWLRNHEESNISVILKGPHCRDNASPVTLR